MTSGSSIQDNHNEFYPCYLDVGVIRELSSFGWTPGIDIPNQVLSVMINSLWNYLKTYNDLSELFTDDKLLDMAREYMKYYKFIKNTQDWAESYLVPSTNEEKRLDEYSDSEWIESWEDKLHEVYEKYLTSQTIFDKILYSMVLTGLLWNPKFDPKDPRIRDVNMRRVSLLRSGTIVDGDGKGIEFTSDDSILVESVSEGAARVLWNKFQGKVKSTISPSKYKLDIDEDGKILIKKNFKANLHSTYSKMVKLMKIYRDTNNIRELKSELAKLFYMNELIEIKYVYNDNMSSEEKSNYKRFISLRANILSSFKEYLTFVLSKDENFDFTEYYENSPYASVLTIDRKHIKGIRSMIKLLLGGK